MKVLVLSALLFVASATTTMLFAAAAQSSQTVTYTAFETPTCSDAGSASDLDQGACYALTGQNSSIKVTCSTQANMCYRAARYSDAGCSTLLSYIDGVGNACYNGQLINQPYGFLLAAGALWNSIPFLPEIAWSDFGCNSPIYPPTITPYRRCTLVKGVTPPQYVLIDNPTLCSQDASQTAVVNMEFWNASTTCAGASSGVVAFPNNATACTAGTSLSCSSSSVKEKMTLPRGATIKLLRRK